MNKKTLFLCLIIVVGLLGSTAVFVANSARATSLPPRQTGPNLVNHHRRLPKKKKIVKKKNVTPLVVVLKPIAKPTFNAAGPLVSNQQTTTSSAPLTIGGVLAWTNIERHENGALAPLLENAQLDLVAAERLRDMFAEQYFDHVSPSGVSPSDVAQKQGYHFIAFGENIALGSYQNDQALVQAWMNSSHHRANILNKHYTEIGVAVGKAQYRGQETWIAVQNFGTPLSACPQPNETLKATIDEKNILIRQLQVTAVALKKELENNPPTDPAATDVYAQKIAEYNILANRINSLISEAKNAVTSYNEQTALFNQCAGTH